MLPHADGYDLADNGAATVLLCGAYLLDRSRPHPLLVGTIAARAGYTSEFAFAKAFKREHGIAPGGYRRVTPAMPDSAGAPTSASAE